MVSNITRLIVKLNWKWISYLDFFDRLTIPSPAEMCVRSASPPWCGRACGRSGCSRDTRNPACPGSGVACERKPHKGFHWIMKHWILYYFKILHIFNTLKDVILSFNTLKEILSQFLILYENFLNLGHSFPVYLSI